VRASTWCWPVVVLAACGDGTGPGNDLAPQDPADAVFITNDIDNFWAAYDAGGVNGSASAFQAGYLDKASAGLKDFIQARNLRASDLAAMVTAYPQYFASIRDNLEALTDPNGVVAIIRENYETIESLYPDAVFPPVTFLVGRFSTAGTIRESGILIGAEFYAVDAQTPLTELGAFQRANVHALDSIVYVVAHEHVHVLQAQVRSGPLGGGTLLQQSLMEGSADFVGELASGGNINTHVYEYGYAHEAELWAEFQAEMNGSAMSRWLYNQGSPPAGRPGDLGYFIGYRIAQAYYDRSTDKSAALREIICASNANAFLAANAFLTASGYNGGGP
jgi:hypothetical protein